MSSSEESVLRFVACLREARQLLHDPAVRQLLGRLDAGDLLLEAPPEPLRAPELGLEEVSTDEEDSSLWSYGTDPGIPAELSPPATPLYHSPIWDPALSAEFRVLGALLRDGPMDGGRLFRVMFDFRSSSRHIPDRLGSFVDWVVSRPRLFRCTNDGVVHAVDGAVEFLARKRDVIGYLAGCPGYKSTASALQEAIPNLGEEVRRFRKRACFVLFSGHRHYYTAGVGVLHGVARGGGRGDVRVHPGASPVLLQPRVALGHAPPAFQDVQVPPRLLAESDVPPLARPLAQVLQDMVTAVFFYITIFD